MYKIVDYVTGWETDYRFECVEDARQILEEMRIEFIDAPSNRNQSFNKVVVPANYQWKWHEKKDKYVWG